MLYTNVCKHCYNVFKSKIQTCTCKKCRLKDENQFDDIEKYLVLYPNSNALQISEELGIHVYTIVKYMEEGRLLVNPGTFSPLEESKQQNEMPKKSKKPFVITEINKNQK